MVFSGDCKSNYIDIYTVDVDVDGKGVQKTPYLFDTICSENSNDEKWTNLIADSGMGSFE